MPAKRPCASTAAAPEKPSFGAGSRPWRASMRRRACDRAATGLGQRIGDADKGEIIAGAAVAGERCRQQVLRAVNAQQRDIVGLVGGDAFGMAKTRDRDGLAAVGDLRRRDQMALAGHHDGGAVFDAAPQPGRRCGARIGKALVAIGHGGGDRRHDAFGGSIEQNGDAAQLAAARLDADDEPLQALQSRHDEGIGRERRMLDDATAYFLFGVEQRRQRALVQAKCLDVDLTPSRRPAAAHAGRHGLRHQRTGQAEPCARHQIVDDAPSRRRQRALRRRTDGIDRGIGIVRCWLCGDGDFFRGRFRGAS